MILEKKQENEGLTVCIAHVDLPAELWQRHRAGQRRVLSERYAVRLRAAGVRVMAAAVFIHPQEPPQGALAEAMGQIGALLTELDDCDSAFCLVRTAAQLDAALTQNKIAVILAMEGTAPLGNDPLLLRSFYELGVRQLGLTWNGRALAADGCAVPGRGLTAFGQTLVDEASRLGMILDVSHLNDEGFWEVLEQTKGPVMASHSNCRNLCEHPRNLTDEQVRALAKRGGIIGLNQVRFLAEGPSAGQGLAALEAHAKRLVDLAGPGNVGLGIDLARDYVQALPKPRSFWEQYDPAEEDIWNDYADAAELARRLRGGGCSPQTVSAILGENLLRFWRASL